MSLQVGASRIEKNTGSRMVRRAQIEPRTYRAYARKDIDKIPQLRHLSPHEILAMKAVSAVLPFRVNNYVVENLIDGTRSPTTPSTS